MAIKIAFTRSAAVEFYLSVLCPNGPLAFFRKPYDPLRSESTSDRWITLTRIRNAKIIAMPSHHIKMFMRHLITNLTIRGAEDPMNYARQTSRTFHGIQRKSGCILCLIHGLVHDCSNSSAIGSDNGLSPARRQTIIWTNTSKVSIRPEGAYFSEIVLKIQKFSFRKMHLETSSAKWHPLCTLCLGPNVLPYFLLVPHICVVELDLHFIR